MDYKEKVIAILNSQELSKEQKEMLEQIFPEFKDEMTRKEILNFFKQLDEGTTICGRNYDYAKWIAWLEKQGKQKQTKLLICPTTLTITSGCMDTYHAKTTIAHLAPCA